MTTDQFIAKWTGKGIDFDGVYGDQCMDLMHQYCSEVLSITNGQVLAAPAAKDVYLNYPNIIGSDLFDKIDNTPKGVPEKGDIMFWGTGIDEYGHVAIFKDGDANNFNSFDQNWNGHQFCESISHSYTGILGWLHPKEAVPMAVITQEELDQTRKDRDQHYNDLQDALKSIQTLNTKIEQQAQTIATDARDDYDLGTKNLELSQELNALNATLKDIASSLITIPVRDDILKAIDKLKKAKTIQPEKLLQKFKRLLGLH